MILAVHSSPHSGGNLERMVLKVLEASASEHELIKLDELNVSPCKGCVSCAQSKRCVQKDDMLPLYDKLEKADALIIGGLNYNGRFNSLIHIFLERLFPLYHHAPVLRNIPAAVVAVGGENPEKGASDIACYLKEITMCNIVGTVLFKSDTPPCFSCGFGTECTVGMPALHWTDKEFRDFSTVKQGMFQRIEDNEDSMQGCFRLGQTLAAAAKGLRTRPRSGGGYYLSI